MSDTYDKPQKVGRVYSSTYFFVRELFGRIVGGRGLLDLLCDVTFSDIGTQVSKLAGQTMNPERNRNLREMKSR